MNYFLRTVPSLDALVVFEAAARFENYTRAAGELQVSQVAVSKRIRALEAVLGTTLFERSGRNLVLTAEGRIFANRVRAGLSFLEEGITLARGGASRQRQAIQVAANENVNFFWLAPLVREFQMSGNEAVVSVVSANNVSDVVRADTDLAIFHAAHVPEGWSSQVLFSEIVAPVARPDYLSRLRADNTVPVCLLDYRKEAPGWVNWESLLAGAARDWFPRQTIMPCSSYIQSISRAIEGVGVGLGVLPLLKSEIEARRLAVLDDVSVATGNHYHLAVPDVRPPSAATTALIDFLCKACATSPV